MTSQASREQAQRLFDLSQRLLDDGGSVEAVGKARMAVRCLRGSVEGRFNLASVLIDAAGQLPRARYAREGVELLLSIEKDLPDELEAQFHYNLGNAYSVIGRRERGKGPGTKPSLLTAISHLDHSLTLEELPNARVNLARALLMQGRWIESHDQFNAVVDEHPDHHQALALRGSSLMGIHNWTSGHKGLLTGALMDHQRAESLAAGDQLSCRSYRSVIRDLQRAGIEAYEPRAVERTPDQAWIIEQGLGLNPCPICHVESPGAFDLYPLAARIEGGSRRPPVEAAIEIVNAVCRSYATSRWILYKAMCSLPEEGDHVISLRVHPDSVHDLGVGLIMSAISGFYSLLGQTAYGLNSYFRLGHDPKYVTFETVWYDAGSKRKGAPKDRSQIHSKLVRRPWPALSALYSLARSLEIGRGHYEQLRTLRNRIEHHVVVASPTASDEHRFVALSVDELRSAALQMGRIAKAAVWYFGAAVFHDELQRLGRAAKRGCRIHPGSGLSVERS